MTLISTITLSSTTDITFSSIPQTFKNLYIVLSLRAQTSSSTDFGLMTFNGAGSGHYTLEMRKTDANNYSANSWNNQAWAVASSMPGSGSTAGFSAETITIFDYASSSVEKAWQSDSGNSNYGGNNQATARIAGGRWNSTSPITSIRFFGSEGNLLSGSRISLYGIQTA